LATNWHQVQGLLLNNPTPSNKTAAAKVGIKKCFITPATSSDSIASAKVLFANQ